jgi:hypothetical protein
MLDNHSHHHSESHHPSHHHPSHHPEGPHHPHHKHHRISPFWVVLFLFVILIAILPTILSGSFGKNLLVMFLESKTKAKISIEKLELCWLGPQKIKDIQLVHETYQIAMNAVSVKLPLWSLYNLPQATKKSIFLLETDVSIENGSVSLKKPALEFNQIHVAVQSDSDKILGSITGKTKASGLDGSLSFSAEMPKNTSLFNLIFSSGKLNLQLQNFPTILLDHTVSTFWRNDFGFLSKFLGKALSLSTSCNIAEEIGPVDFSLQSTNSSIEIHGIMSPNLFTLRSPIISSFYFEDFLHLSFLKEVSPFFVTAIKSITPMKLQIDNKGFSLPLPFSLKTLHIDHGVFDMGKVEAKNGSTLAFVVGLMRLKNLMGLDQMSIWCNAMGFSLNQGVLSTERMDALLADAIHVCTWGDIDLAKNRLNMILGITADALRYSFGIKNLPDSYVMQIPMTGSPSHVQIDTKSAMAKIGALLAVQTAGKAGSILSPILQSIDQEQKAPPPQKPFPWEGKISPQKTPANRSSPPKDNIPDNAQDFFRIFQ